ncbi:ABC transporter ATP-binding protein [Sphingomonas parva]|uniref:ABC transporter ATP-binding protein n=1 Tax=Sphingomonas parva TaxID=2555898 RepID=A0A4Y8ZM04_9SPHN|nr:ABC transporter ATP-binding protein [Sphingomonas parva]TFI57031.1 ABC transporter ATP-binding protein [Sphingomonas parva]
MESEGAVVELVDLSKTYRGRRGGVHAVRNVSISVGAGEVYGFLGPNGAGKSTTIRMLLGLIAPTGGEVRLFGEALRSNPRTLRRVGSLVDGGAFYPFLSGRRNLQVLARTHGGEGADARIDPLLEQVGLAHAAERRVKGYSTGMRQRLGVAAALLHDPDLVILDEPVNGLDAAGIQEMRMLIRNLCDEQGKTVFLSSHLLHEVQQVCDRVAIISRGEIVREATIAELLRQDEGLRIEASPLAMAQSALEGRWAVEPDGGAIRVAATQEEAPEVVRRLVGAGVDVFGLAPERRNLEEVFLSITQEDPDA